jgi:hypothetical protein
MSSNGPLNQVIDDVIFEYKKRRDLIINRAS